MTTTKTTLASSVEVPPKATRRNFPTEYKISIIERADRCKTKGDIGRLLRQEGLYSSHLSTWRAARRAGSLEALGRKRGPKKAKTEEQLHNERLQRDNERLRKKLSHAEKIIAVQKKLSEVLGISLNGDATDESESD